MTQIDSFRQTIAAAGLEAPDQIQDDGAIHRFSTNGRHGDESGWYVLHTDGVASGAFGCWRTGLHSTWCSKSHNTMTAAERDTHRHRMNAMQEQRDAEQGARQQAAAADAAQRLKAASACTGHPYLIAKGVKPHGIKVDRDNVLLIPMRDSDSKLWNIERVNPADFKDKKGLFGGRRTSCYHSIGNPSDGVLIVCEGYATGASIYEATSHAVAIAFNAGNLESVAVALHRKYPSLLVLVAADDDWLTPGNPGRTSANAAALAVGGLVAVPRFPAVRPDKATDFNDLHAIAGLDAVRACFAEVWRP
jgi:putative DNA primase/helicase